MPKTHTNKFWEDLVLALIGDQFTLADDVLGLVLNLRPGRDTLQVWHRHGKDEEKKQTLLKDLEAIISLEEGMTFEHAVFSDVIEKKPEQIDKR